MPFPTVVSSSSLVSQTGMKKFSISTHTSDPSRHFYHDHDILINSKDFPGLQVGDILEIIACDDIDKKDDKKRRFFLKVGCCMVDTPEAMTKLKPSEKLPKIPSNTLCILQSIAQTFGLKFANEVFVSVVSKESVTLDSVELIFKDQYLSRSMMWRLKCNQLVDDIVYSEKKISFNGFNGQVFEMWAGGSQRTSGFVGPETKVVYRSQSSQVFIFLQMSSEMWDFDFNGDLYFEKGVNGFFRELFEKWKTLKCTHDVTIVMFSRTYYEASTIDEFPDSMKPCLQQDYLGRFYEDFYRVAIQNERYEDWSPIIYRLRAIINKWNDEVLHFHEREAGDKKIPKAYNSTASQGNFLEVLNMSLNVFERHNVDRSFDRTGQMSVVVSPGVGVFEVDFHLTNITKQRIIDNGIGSDLVCLGEQPLHAVPLFKFISKDCKGDDNAADIYNMPHWINLSFYSTPRQSSLTSFIPRIKRPTIIDIDVTKREHKDRKDNFCLPPKTFHRSPVRHESNGSGNGGGKPYMTAYEYELHDEQVFKWQTTQAPTPPIIHSPRRKSFNNQNTFDSISVEVGHTRYNDKNRQRRASEYIGSKDRSTDHLDVDEGLGIDIINRRPVSPTLHTLSSSADRDNYPSSFKHKVESQDDISLLSSVPRSGRTKVQRPKALINPFDPSQVTIKLTSNRRRWTHVFPLGPTGIFMQQHHYQAVPQNTACTMLSTEACFSAKKDEVRKISIKEIKDGSINTPSKTSRTSPRPSSREPDIKGRNLSVRAQETHSDTMTYAWGATGEQAWTPAITTGVDWKSLVVPACLPITTDFFPDQRSLQNDYQMNGYILLPEDQGQELAEKPCYRAGDDLRNHLQFSAQQVLEELVCQRLQQGFQFILLPRDIQGFGSKSDINRGNHDYTMSIGRIFHRLIRTKDNTISVTQYKPRHPYPVIRIHYCYRFQAPDNKTYGSSWVEWSSERLENYKWNMMDNYVCMRGEGEETNREDLEESLKFWRLRLLLLPNLCQRITERIVESITESGEKELKCLGAYKESTHEERLQLFGGFLKFIEVISKIKAENRAFKGGRGHKEVALRRPSGTPGVASPGGQLKTPNQRTSLGPQSPLAGRPTPGKSPRTKSGGSYTGTLDEVDGNLCSTMVTSSTSSVFEDSLAKPPAIKTISPGKPGSTSKMPRPSLAEVASMMMTSEKINCLMTQNGLPANSFVSADAILWAIETFQDVESESQAVKMFKEMLEEGLICHASRVRRFPFICGFYIYFIVVGKFDEDKIDVECFEKDWLQVEMCLKEVTNTEESMPAKATGHDFYKEFSFNRATLDLDSKTERVEWVHLRYHNMYDPGQAFEIDMDWVVATGNLVADVIRDWTRKASIQRLHIVPIPSEPFALPFAGRSDPLRGPIYVDLNLGCLPQVLKGDKLVAFREKILSKWGFLPFDEPREKKTDKIARKYMYVHVSGSMFVLIPQKSDRQASDADATDDDHVEFYINKHFTGTKHSLDDEKQTKVFKTGFLWSWNYMITKRWKNVATGDEAFMRRVMADFTAFCANNKNRLLDFYHENL